MRDRKQNMPLEKGKLLQPAQKGKLGRGSGERDRRCARRCVTSELYLKIKFLIKMGNSEPPAGSGQAIRRQEHGCLIFKHNV